jgi:hypothetical protein
VSKSLKPLFLTSNDIKLPLALTFLTANEESFTSTPNELLKCKLPELPMIFKPSDAPVESIESVIFETYNPLPVWMNTEPVNDVVPVTIKSLLTVVSVVSTMNLSPFPHGLTTNADSTITPISSPYKRVFAVCAYNLIPLPLIFVSAIDLILVLRLLDKLKSPVLKMLIPFKESPVILTVSPVTLTLTSE